MRIFKTPEFARFARKEKIGDKSLSALVAEMEGGLIDADLGHGLIKKRLARSGQGKSRGYRTIIVYRAKKRAIFVYGFSKSDKQNLTSLELEGYRHLASFYLSLTDAGIAKAVRENEMKEIGNE